MDVDKMIGQVVRLSHNVNKLKVVLASDGEGNEYSLLQEVAGIGLFKSDGCEGEVKDRDIFIKELKREGLSEKEIQEELGKWDQCLILYPY